MSKSPVSIVEENITLNSGRFTVKTYKRTDWDIPSVWCFKSKYSSELKEYLTSRIYDKSDEFFPIFKSDINKNDRKRHMILLTSSIISGF